MKWCPERRFPAFGEKTLQSFRLFLPDVLQTLSWKCHRREGTRQFHRNEEQGRAAANFSDCPSYKMPAKSLLLSVRVKVKCHGLLQSFTETAKRLESETGVKEKTYLFSTSMKVKRSEAHCWMRMSIQLNSLIQDCREEHTISGKKWSALAWSSLLWDYRYCAEPHYRPRYEPRQTDLFP